jgi:branched-chain amino acid transport system ATP-binding protein
VEPGVSALVARGVSVRFGGLVAVDAIDLAIAPRELVGIIGPNGAGKTTFFNALSGVQRPSAGRLEVGGADLTGRPPHAFAGAGIARTFQTLRVFREMSVRDNLRFGASFAGRRRGGASAAAVLDIVGLADAIDQPAGRITPARQRRLEIGMALSTAPNVLLLDEVAAGLSEAETQAMAQLIRRCRDELGLAVVWIEHAVRVLLGAVERVVVLHQGRKLADGAPASVARDAAVIEAYLGTAA